MKKLVLKELREHFKVALLGLAVLTVMVVLLFQSSTARTLQAAASQGYSADEGLQPLLSKGVLTQVAFFCAIFGALLGWLQIRAEKHPDLWAFLVHRPITRTTILRAKVISGLLLYVAGAGLPLLGLVVVCSIPGKVAAPFAWVMALPLFAIFLVGMVYYLAGLLTGLRKARWFASRGFGLGLPIAATFGVFGVNEFWQALLIVVAAGAILALAVWGSFLTGGHYRAQPAPSKLALTVTSVISVALLIGLLIGLVASLATRRNDYTYTQYQLLMDGSIVRITYHIVGGAYEDPEVVDLQGRPRLDETTGQKFKQKEMHKYFPASLGTVVNFKEAPLKRTFPRQGYSDAARFFTPWRSFNKAIWYFTVEGQLVAYHGITRRVVGSLAPPGGPAGAPDDTRFLPLVFNSYFRDYSLPETLASSRTAYTVDLEKLELKPIFTVTNGDVIGGCAESGLPSVPMNPYRLLILTRHSIRLMGGDGQTLLQLPYAPAPPEYTSVSVLMLETNQGYALRFEPDYVLNQKSGGKLLTHVEWVNSDGSIRNNLDLPKLPELQQDNSMERVSIAFLPPAFPIYTWEKPYRSWQVFRLGPAILCALVSWRLGRQNNFSLRANVGWGVFNFLFGIPGVLAFLAVQEWPAKEPCLQCRKLRVVSRDCCEHCDAAFAPPEKTGVEIFEPLKAN